VDVGIQLGKKIWEVAGENASALPLLFVTVTRTRRYCSRNELLIGKVELVATVGEFGILIHAEPLAEDCH